MSDLSRRFGRTVRQAREQQGYSQEQLAEIANLNRSYLGEIERGVVIPSLATLEKLALALGESLSRLLSRCENTAP
ncbi:MAG TPA: helix-turn-helix transcriptional regulator [Fluviicoccus sp.]|nr:helix-turn-helix transcriptional regulator [Fluviicoccus sp.]